MNEVDHIMNSALSAWVVANLALFRPIQMLFPFRPFPCLSANFRPGS